MSNSGRHEILKIKSHKSHWKPQAKIEKNPLALWEFTNVMLLIECYTSSVFFSFCLLFMIGFLEEFVVKFMRFGDVDLSGNNQSNKVTFLKNLKF